MTTIDSTVAMLTDVRKRHGAIQALDGVDLQIERGKVLALLGPNGAGKSTAISLLLGLADPDSGRAMLFGQSPHAVAARRRIGVMLQNAALQDTLRVSELIGTIRTYYPHPRSIEETARLAGIEPLLDRLYSALSGGQQRRVQFALAICGNPQLLFLDEPTTGLDLEAREHLWATLRSCVRDGCAVLLTTHYIEEAEALADSVVVLMEGRVVAKGSGDEIRAKTLKRHIRCISNVDAHAVRTWSGVTVASRRDGWLDIEAPAAEGVVRRLLDADPTLTELEIRRAGLGEAFVQITREFQP